MGMNEHCVATVITSDDSTSDNGINDNSANDNDSDNSTNVNNGCRSLRVKRFQDLLSESTKALISRAALAPGETVVDIGCGDGTVSLMLAEQVGESGCVYAIDMDEEKILHLKAQAESLGINNIKPLHASAEKILPTLPSIDAVYSRFVLMHVEEPVQLLRQLQQVLPQGGRVILEEPVIRATYDYPSSGLWESAIDAYRKLCAVSNIDPDYGLKLPVEIASSGFDLRFAQQIQPLLSVETGKKYLLAALTEHKEEYLTHDVLSVDEYTELLNATSSYGDSDVDYCVFHGVMQIIANKI